VRVGIVGFTTEDTPELIFPGNLGPFHLVDDITTVNAEAARINSRVDAIVALGHEGVTGGTLTEPSGPVVGLADAALNIDSVIGDHNDFQVLASGPNGVLLTQNRGRGVRRRCRGCASPGTSRRRPETG
jgi:2',3'-cyclic-nucleotide 2'-phosphodiesterase (5'-nucleotidase family)